MRKTDPQKTDRLDGDDPVVFGFEKLLEQFGSGLKQFVRVKDGIV